MQFGDSDNLHYQPQETSCLEPGALHFFRRGFNKLFRSPLTYVLMVWGLLFVILGFTLAYAQDASHDASQKRATASSRKAVSHTARQSKTETVEIFSAGEDPVVPSHAPAAIASQHRRTYVAPRRTRR